MSITFWAPDAPTKLVRPYPDEPDYEETVSALPELNISNFNARAFLRLMELPQEDCGTIETGDCAVFARRAMMLLNQSDERLPALRNPTQHQAIRVVNRDTHHHGRPGPRIIDCGLSDTQVERYAATFLALLSQASQQGYKVTWG